MKIKHDVVVVGGGASGLLFAVLCARAGKSVAIIEKNPTLGKKLLSTGNGRCNFCNINSCAECYNDTEFMSEIFVDHSLAEVIDVFEELGLCYYVDEEGRCYPKSNSSASVLSVFLMWLEKYKVDVFTNEAVLDIQKNADGFYNVLTSKQTFVAPVCAYAVGGGQENLLKSIDLIFAKQNSALAGLKTDSASVSGLFGVRCKVRAKIANEMEDGEVIFKEDGISGICIMNLQSKRLWKNLCNEICLDLLPDENDKIKFFTQRREKLKELKMQDFFCGLFCEKLSKKLLSITGFNQEQKIEELSDGEIENISGLVGCYKLKISGIFPGGQVTNGGIKTKEITKNYESKNNPGLFFLGEAVNIDGICGGFNLGHAFLSSILAFFALKNTKMTKNERFLKKIKKN